MEETSHLAKRSTLVKVRVGCPKMSTRDLPGVDHTYGYTAPTDAESKSFRAHFNCFSYEAFIITYSFSTCEIRMMRTSELVPFN